MARSSSVPRKVGSTPDLAEERHKRQADASWAAESDRQLLERGAKYLLMENADSMGKLRRFWRWKRDRGEGLAPDAPVFANQSRRLSLAKTPSALTVNGLHAPDRTANLGRWRC